MNKLPLSNILKYQLKEKKNLQRKSEISIMNARGELTDWWLWGGTPTSCTYVFKMLIWPVCINGEQKRTFFPRVDVRIDQMHGLEYTQKQIKAKPQLYSGAALLATSETRATLGFPSLFNGMWPKNDFGTEGSSAHWEICNPKMMFWGKGLLW